MFQLPRCLLVFLLVLTLAGCAAVPVEQRRKEADNLATVKDWHRIDLDAGDFVLGAYVPRRIQPADVITVYIEGDGLAWVSSSTPSLDPTPINPLALKLALRDDSSSVYLARPCQYVNEPQQRNCAQKYWTSHRFAPEVVSATSTAIDQIKQRFGASKLILVGYSGGAAVATLVAAERKDVIRLITIAGNLDHRAWTVKHHLLPLSGSLNPADAWQQLQHIPQAHYVGGMDRVVGEDVARAYAARFPEENRPEIIVMPDYDHYCCWEGHWPMKRQ